MKDGSITRRDFIRIGVATGTALGLHGIACGQGGGGTGIRCGLIGAGGRGSELLEESLKIEGVSFRAICDINQENLERAQHLVEKTAGQKPEGYNAGPTDYKRLLAREDIDAVVIATPCDLHAPMYLDAISAGKHLYGEKPMCLTVAEADKIVEAERGAKGLVVCIGFQRRANPRYQEAIKLIHRGEIGDLIEGRGAWDNEIGPLRGWFSVRAHSGDWVVEQACHSWDIFNWVAGATPLRAFSLGRKDLFTADESHRDVADFYTAIIEYPKGFTVTFSHSWFHPRDEAFTGFHEKIVGLKGGCVPGEGRFVYRDRSRQAKVVGREVNETAENLKAFYQCLREGRTPPSGVRNGRDALLVGLMIRRAYDEEKVVTWDEMLKSS